MDRNNVWTTLAGAALIALLTAACTGDQRYEYLAHSDTVTQGAGNATAANKAVHTIDPWSANSQKAQIEMDGKRAQIAARRYETNTSIKPKGLSADAISISVGNGISAQKN